MSLISRNVLYDSCVVLLKCFHVSSQSFLFITSLSKHNWICRPEDKKVLKVTWPMLTINWCLLLFKKNCSFNIFQHCFIVKKFVNGFLYSVFPCSSLIELEYGNIRSQFHTLKELFQIQKDLRKISELILSKSVAGTL